MTEKSRQERIREVWGAVSESDVEALSGLTADEVVWHASGRGPRSGDLYGLHAILDYLAAIGEDVERFDAALEDILIGESRDAMLVQVSGMRRGREIETGEIVLLRFDEEQVAEVWSVPRDQIAIDEFWS